MTQHQDFLDKLNKHVETHKAVHEAAKQAAEDARLHPEFKPADREHGMSAGRL